MKETTNAAMPTSQVDPDILLTRLQVERLLNVSRDAFQTIRKSKELSFPAPVDIGLRVKRWRPSSVLAWIDSRAAVAAAC